MGLGATFPYQDFCVLKMIFPFLSVATIAQVKQHFLSFLFFIFFTISIIPFPFLKNLDDLIPGFLSMTETSIPESSENETAFTSLEREPAFL